jgi:integrase
VTATTEKEAKKKLADLRKRLLLEGDLPTSSQTFASWLNVWFTTIALKKIRPKTAATYRTLIENHIIPTIGPVQLEKLTPAHIRRVAASIEAKGLSSTTAMQAHRIMAVALKYAEREGRVHKNVANLTDAPRRASKKLTVLTGVHGVKVLDAVREDRLASRWAAALLTGARQGELLGLELDRVGDDLDLSWQLQRVTWEHGCKVPCGRKRAAECPDKKITFPPDWEHRHLTGGLYLSRPKSNAGWRVVPLVDPLRAIIELRAQTSRTEPNPHGLMWTALPDGRPIDPSRDNAAWHAILARAGVPDARLHDARHTTASLLRKANVPIELITKIMGHSSYAQSREYMDVDREQLMEALTSMSALMS